MTIKSQKWYFQNCTNNLKQPSKALHESLKALILQYCFKTSLAYQSLFIYDKEGLQANLLSYQSYEKSVSKFPH